MVHNTVFLVIECEVLYLNENNVPPKPFGLFSVRVAHNFCSLRVFFHETSPQWPFTGENVTGLGSVILYAGQNLWYF